ncbi:MAG TPA: 2'-5' RNA ligase family protein, partial [Patescibacteria group bacterium]|nr:2'-5' RNA ligase family protein [Patescibacteria group bacterium]
RTGGILNGREFFHPHVTITRVKDAVDAERAREVVDAAPPYRFGVDRLYLAHLGPNGTVSDIVEEFKLK